MLLEPVEGAAGLLKLVLEHGDEETRRLPSAFYGQMSGALLEKLESDIYQGMLISFHFSSLCTEHLIQNYETMLKGLVEIGHCTAFALLDCG